MLRLVLTLLFLANVVNKVTSTGTSTSTSWFSGLFGKSKDEKNVFGDGVEEKSSNVAQEPPPVPIRRVEAPRKSKRDVLFKKKKEFLLPDAGPLYWR